MKSIGPCGLGLKPGPANIMKTLWELILQPPTNLTVSNRTPVNKTSNENVITLFKTQNTYEPLIQTGGVWHNLIGMLFGWINLDRLSALSRSPLQREKSDQLSSSSPSNSSREKWSGMLIILVLPYLQTWRASYSLSCCTW